MGNIGICFISQISQIVTVVILVIWLIERGRATVIIV